MSRVPLPKEVRPGFGALVESAVLLFRQESIEVAALLAIGGIALPTFRILLPGWLDGTLYLPGGSTIPLRTLGFGFLDCALQSALLLFLVPVAAGARGLSSRAAFAHLGPLGLVVSVMFAIQVGMRLALSLSLTSLAGDRNLMNSWYLRSALGGLLPALLVVWSAWYLGNAVRRQRDDAVARARLLVWPGLLVALLMGVLGSLIPWTGFFGVHRLTWLGFGPLGYKAVFNFGWGLCVVFAALWMLRAVENEAGADPAG